MLAVIRLAAADGLPSISCRSGELVRPVHPKDARVDVLLIKGPDLQDPGNPVVGARGLGGTRAVRRGL